MPSFRFTRRAESDLQEIADYSLSMWGETQCLRYIDSLEQCCQRLAESPSQGRACNDLQPGYFRIEHARHVLFFRKSEDGVLIIRILHACMLSERHLEEIEEEEQVE